MGSCVDPELWKLYAGGLVKVPLVNSKVMYFPQGHAEHANGIVNFVEHPEIPSFVKCRVALVKYMADVETDDLYLRMTLVPLRMDEDFMEFEVDDLVGRLSGDGVENCSSFTKILTQSDANNGGGFSVPRHCAQSLFPKLDYSADPPVQNLHIKDVHGVFWMFRHIYRGTPRRHLLTTGWSNFVNDKKLVAGDSVVFVKTSSGELCIGFRRANRGISGFKPKDGLWEFNSLFGNGSKGDQMIISSPRKNGKVSAETVLETARRSAAGREFEVDYYPRAGFPEFCVKSSVVSSALRIQWCTGMKFKMAFESKDASKDNWFVGTIQAVKAADPARWPKSPWRMLKVRWDEPTLMNYVERVSPWSIDIAVGGMLNVHPVASSHPMKRLRLAQPPELSLHKKHPPSLPDPFIRNLSYYPVADKALAGIQGARHVQFGKYPSNVLLNVPPNPHLFPQFKKPFRAPLPALVGANFKSYQKNEEDTLPKLNLRMSPSATDKNVETETNVFFLFGQRIILEEKKTQSSSAATPIPDSYITCDGNTDKIKSGTESSESGSVQNGKECISDDRSTAEIEIDPQTSGASHCN